MDRARLEKAYQGVDFVRRSLLEVRKRLESQKADVVAHYGENTPLSISYDRDMMKVDELVKTIGEYLGTCDDWKIMNLLKVIRFIIAASMAKQEESKIKRRSS